MANRSIAERWQACAPFFLSLLRIVAALMFIMSGTMKLFAYPMGMPPNGAKAELFTQIGLAGVLETFGGTFILLGLFTRPIAFILSGEMAVAYFQAHFPISPWPIVNNGVGAVLYCFIWLYISAAGAGPFSLDRMRRK